MSEKEQYERDIIVEDNQKQQEEQKEKEQQNSNQYQEQNYQQNQKNTHNKPPRKGWGKFWIVMLIMAAVGITFSLTGVAMGATLGELSDAANKWSNKQYQSLRHTWHWGDDEEFTPLGDDSVFGTAVVKDDDGNCRYIIETNHIKDISKINIEADAMNIEIHTAKKGEPITVEFNEELEEYLSVRGEEGDGDEKTLVIEDRSRDRFVMFNFGFDERYNGKVKVYLPEDIKPLKEFIANVSAGSVKVKAPIKSEKVYAFADAGKIEFTEVSAGMIDSNVNAGKLEFKKIISNDDFSGTFGCDMGKIEAVFEGSEDEFNAQLNCDLGNIEYGSKDYSGVSQSVSFEGKNTSKNLGISVDVGKISVKFTK
jgi:hypothetical protein